MYIHRYLATNLGVYSKGLPLNVLNQKKSTKRKNDDQEINAKQETFTLSLNNLFIEEHSLRSTDHCCKAEHNILS